VTDAWDAEDRAIARALGVEPPDDGGRADEDTVADYEAVVSALPFEEVAPAADLEDRMVSAALARRPAAVRAINTTRNADKPARARSARRWLAAGVAAVAAAAIVVVLIAGRTPSGSGAGGRVEPAAANGGVAKVLADPGTRKGVLRSPTGVAGGKVLLDPGGSGYLTGLPIPAGGTTSWLWLETVSPVRVGPIPDASTVHFVVHGDVGAVRGVIITTDPGAPAPFSWRALLSNSRTR
jgi:hypothetical protein